MTFFSEIHIVLLRIIISKVIIVYTNDKLSQHTENQTSITIDDLNNLAKAYPAFIMLILQKHDYYTGKDIARCPMRYNENTILDDPDVVQSEYFNPRECKKPWTWTQKNEIDVPIPINDTIGKKLGNIIRPSIKNNTNIIQSYIHYLNVMESVALTLVDRFCLFKLEAFNILAQLGKNVDYKNDFSLFKIRVNITLLSLYVHDFKEVLKEMYDAFKKYYISTLPLDCIENLLKKISSEDLEYDACQWFNGSMDKFYNQLLFCRHLMKSKRNYAALNNDKHWKWDISSNNKPDSNLLILAQHENYILGLKFFANKNTRTKKQFFNPSNDNDLY